MLLHSILDVLFPRYCPMCDSRLLPTEKLVCSECNEELPRTLMWTNSNRNADNKYKKDDNIFKEIEEASPADSRQEKSKQELFKENELAKKYWGRTCICRAMAFLKYTAKSRTANIIYHFKYKNRPDIAVECGKLMATEIKPSGFFDNIDYLIPIPLTYGKEAKRGYNQSMELAKGISKIVGIPIKENILKRKKYHISQTQLSPFERQQNISGAFALNDKKSAALTNKHILLIDDVITTGATTIECCNVLNKIEGITISVLSLAMVKQ